MATNEDPKGPFSFPSDDSLCFDLRRCVVKPSRMTLRYKRCRVKNKRLWPLAAMDNPVTEKITLFSATDDGIIHNLKAV